MMLDEHNSDFHDFHLREIPRLLLGKDGQQAIVAARELGSLCIRLSNTDDSYTYCPRASTIDIVAGTEGEITIGIDYVSWWDFVSAPRVTAHSVIFKDKLRHGYRGNEDLLQWEQVLGMLFQTV